MIRSVGIVGDAAGILLKEIVCEPEEACINATVEHLCRTTPGCDTVERRHVYTHAPCDLQSFKKEGKRKHCAYLMRMWRRSLRATKPSVGLRASFRAFQTHAPDLQPTVERCKAIAQRAARVRPFDSLSMNARRRWNEQSCDEFAATSTRPLPRLGGILPALRPEGLHCPPAGTELLIVTFQQSPSPWLCLFLKSFAYQGVPVTVLGWEPDGLSRNNNVFYYSGRLFATLRYLLACPGLSRSADFIFCDVDEILQASMETVRRGMQTLYNTTGADLIFSAEPRCTPDRAGGVAKAHADAAVPGMHKKIPRCLNTGNYLGSVGSVIQWMNRTCLPCRNGTSIDDVYRRYWTSYSAHVRDWIYPEQYTAMEMYLAAPPRETRWILDFKQVLFHPNYWFSTGFDVTALPDGRLQNKRSGSIPAWLHYNGNSKSRWRKEYAARTVAAAMRRQFAARVGGRVRAHLDSYLREKVAFLGSSFERRAVSSFSEVCAAEEVS